MKTRTWMACLACVAVGFFLASLSQSQLTGEEKDKEPALVKWEYKYIVHSEERFNKLGNDGWELVAFEDRGKTGTYAHFKRPKR